MTEIIVSGQLPVLALRGLVVYPKQTVHFDVARPKSVKALEAAMEKDQLIFLVPQKSIIDEDPGADQLYPMGCVAKVKQVLKNGGEMQRVLVTGVYRGRITEMNQNEPYMLARVEMVQEKSYTLSPKVRAYMRDAQLAFSAYLEMSQHPAQQLQLKMMASTDPSFVADTIAQYVGFDYPDKCRLLSQLNPALRLEQASKLLTREIEMLTIEMEIQQKARENMEQYNRDYYLREQMKIIRQELGEGETDGDADIYREKILALGLEEEVEKKLLKDIDRLAKQPYGSQEGAVLRGYLDTVLELPWKTKTKERIDISAARKILEKDHYGMEKVKERILETLAVRRMAPEMPAQIICLVGPPGVGKTSIAYSIAKAVNRKMARISLGGVRDEAEIRGHRKTYVGAMPGRILSGIMQAGSSNPLLLLDEVDKMGMDHRGDPAAALLEVLDAEQNHTYRDHYLEIPYDLSDVMFITTANDLGTIPRPLLDRMEVIELSSYTDEEKLMIAKNHLIPKQLGKHGLKKSQLRITDDAIRAAIEGWTRESGVRNLERLIAKLCRKADLKLVEDEELKKITINAKTLPEYLETRIFQPDELPEEDPVGLVTGLAWTSVGGETLEVEVNVMDGTGKIELTGNLGLVMQESARAAVSYIRAHCAELNIDPVFYKTKDIHIHFPEGAVPKDGPSAGVTVTTAIVSALTGRTVRRDVAMTGEISLRGRVMAIGGLKEKTMAAFRHGCKTVIIPAANERDLADIDPTVREKLHFVIAKEIGTVLSAALNPAEELRPLNIPVEPKRPRAAAEIC
ncbi:MAG: endopeptidase La [Oscillospiraceae bacterium]|nr:endopeptidase La [Oscillospiraceae bacterium]